MSDFASHRLKTRNLRTHRSLAPLDTSNPNYKTSPTRSPIRGRLASPTKSSLKKTNSISYHKSKSPPCRLFVRFDKILIKNKKTNRNAKSRIILPSCELNMNAFIMFFYLQRLKTETVKLNA